MTDGDAALRVPTALAERLGNTDGSPFARAAQKLTAGDELDELRFALVALTNRVLAADRVAPGDDEAVAAALERLVATLDLAIERLAQGDDERGAEALRTIPLARLFRLGVSLSGKVKRLALAVRREGPFGRRGVRSGRDRRRDGARSGDAAAADVPPAARRSARRTASDRSGAWPTWRAQAPRSSRRRRRRRWCTASA